MVNQFRAAVESLYQDTCTVYERKSVTDPVTKITSGTGWEEVHEDKPCRLSYKDLAQAVQETPENKVTKAIKLFIAPELVIKPGSKITVSHNGRTLNYKNTGEPSVYSSHQEIVLELENNKA